MSRRSERLTGGALVLLAVATPLGASLGDPAIESHDDRQKFVEQVGNAADRVPGIYVFQAVDAARGFLAIAVAVCLYLMLRERARGVSVAGLVLFVVSGVFAAATAFIGAGMARAADDYAGGGLDGIGRSSEDTLELIRVLAVLHFGNFLAAFAALGLGVAAWARGLAWSGGAPRWLGLLGLAAGALMLLTPLAVATDLLFLPFFFGAVLTLVWLVIAGVLFLVRRSLSIG